MAETLTSSQSATESIHLESIRSRLKVLSETRDNLLNSSDASSEDSKVLEDCIFNFEEKLKQLDGQEQDVASLSLEELDAYMDKLKKAICSAEEENSKVSSEIEALTKMFVEDSVQLDGEIEALSYSMNFIDAKGLNSLSSIHADDRVLNGVMHESPLHLFNEYKFEIFELNQRIKKSEENLILLQDIDYALKRFEADGQLEAMFSGLRVIDIQGCYVRLSLKTYIPNIDTILLRHKVDFVEPPMSEHEMLVEFSERNMDIKSIEIFPGDVCIEGIIDTIKSSRNFIASTVSSLRWLIIQVQHRIILCMLRRLLVIDANKSRHSFEHSDRDDTVIAHLVGGIDAFIKLASNWPISSYPLKLLSIKNRDDQSQSITLSFLCKVKERANSLATQSRLQLAKFVDGIEAILQEMQSDLHSNNITT
ncbi:uncharacterized protein LOC122042352 isoform X1 [Zingiber officinale]|uniref:uncharacterized protein LOC122042352 isoform X1 n=1 Tax=Zingiber officinale TaxID=94328 RepID=UPI001C4C9577|nr:uncharacterized protein LOC122042352 isoform X1 [Zingiber officinale]